MAATLCAGGGRRFSETARPGPGSGDAVGDGLGGRAGPVGRRALADDGPERAAERAEAGEPHVEADLGHRSLALAQQRHGPLDAAALEVAVGALAEGGPGLAGGG